MEKEIKIMGILNITPDSFYDGGKYTDIETIKGRIKTMIDEGASIIDVGGFSSRPGSILPSVAEELKRIIPVLNILEKYDVDISVDTCRAEVVKELLQYKNIKYINDISGGADEGIFELIQGTDISYILMHTQGQPKDMQKNPYYSDIVQEVHDFFEEKIKELKNRGIHNIIIDPGFGFGKTLEHNYLLLKNLDIFQKLGYEVLVGLSRKSMIYKVFEGTPQDSEGETMALNLLTLEKGATFLRVHDVKKHVHIKKIYTIYNNL